MTDCRLCGDTLVCQLDLGAVPPANRFRRRAELDLPEPRYPLRLGRCPTCIHVQLMDTVPPEDLFTDRDYLYRSGVSAGWLEHCSEMVRRMPKGNGGLAVDIGSNDGTMLGALAARGYQVLGVEPSHPLNALHGYDVLPTFWGEEVGEWVVRKAKQQARVITATNVLAHVPDVEGFLAGVAEALHTDGTLVIEVPHVLPMLETGAFDPIYHEHVHYWSLLALQRAILEAGLSVVACEEIAVHGGSLRVYVGFPHRRTHASVDALLLRETRSLFPGAFRSFAEKVADFRSRWVNLLEEYRASGAVVWGYGASAKGMTLLTSTPVPGAITRIMDDNVAKQGWYTPGEGIPITPVSDLGEPDVVALLAWNWGDTMARRLRTAGFRGPLILPFPDLRVAER